MKPVRLDSMLVKKRLLKSRTQAAKHVALFGIKVNGKLTVDNGLFVTDKDRIELVSSKSYVSRAGHKLEAANEVFKLSFKDKKVLDIGSSTGGFSDYALKNGAQKVIAIELGSDQMDQFLRSNSKLELHEKTDIRDVNGHESLKTGLRLSFIPDIVVIDLSFISLREVLLHIRKLVDQNSEIIALVKPQFEVEGDSKNRGIIKNQKVRRQVLKDFEAWIKLNNFIIVDKADSSVTGLKGNIERFYLLKIAS